MPQEQLFDCAKIGDLEALQKVLNHDLKSQSVQIHDIDVRKDCLQISLESASIPNQTALVPLLQKAVGRLQVSNIHALEVYGHTVGNELPHWMQQIDLQPLADELIAPEDRMTVSPSVPSAQEAVEISKPVSVFPTKNLSQKPTGAVEYSPAIKQLIEDYTAGDRDFQRSNFSEMELPGINLTLADLQESEFIWANLSEASLGHANLTSAKLRHANLSNANLQGTNLQGADLQGANLSGANLSWAKLRGVNFTGADLTDANLLNANLERVTMPDGTYLD
ncbi:MAG: pentapeptide repeat-containing protein [Thermosynechococcaceae cyanobacterium]